MRECVDCRDMVVWYSGLGVTVCCKLSTAQTKSMRKHVFTFFWSDRRTNVRQTESSCWGLRKHFPPRLLWFTTVNSPSSLKAVWSETTMGSAWFLSHCPKRWVAVVLGATVYRTLSFSVDLACPDLASVCEWRMCCKALWAVNRLEKHHRNASLFIFFSKVKDTGVIIELWWSDPVDKNSLSKQNDKKLQCCILLQLAETDAILYTTENVLTVKTSLVCRWTRTENDEGCLSVIIRSMSLKLMGSNMLIEKTNN